MFQVVRELLGHTGLVRDLVISTDGRTIVSGSGRHYFCVECDMTVRVWTAITGEITNNDVVVQCSTFHHSHAPVAISRDGSKFASGGGGLGKNVTVRSTTTGEVSMSFVVVEFDLFSDTGDLEMLSCAFDCILCGRQQVVHWPV